VTPPSSAAAVGFSGLSVPAFCARRVEPMCVDADNVQIAAAARALGVDVAVVDAAAGTGGGGGAVSLSLHPGGGGGGGSNGSGALIRVWLVRLPGHYELLTALDPMAEAGMSTGGW
jgi:hypothetical protein